MFIFGETSIGLVIVKLVMAWPQVKIVASRGQNVQTFELYSRLPNIASENLHYLGNCYS